jgi:hypothetical protein
MLARELLLVSMCLRRCFSFSAFLVATVLGASRARLGAESEATALFRLAGAGASGASASDAASE